MQREEDTHWTLIEGAAAGDAARRRQFADVYLPIVRAYVGARWRGRFGAEECEDAVQDVFVDCFREDGALGRAERARGVRFRTYLFGVVRNVALRHEERRRLKGGAQFATGGEEEIEADLETMSRSFDRAWAQAVVRRAIDRQRAAAASKGPDAARRVELLRLRFQEGKPIRDIAELWKEDAAVLHRQFRTAREEFRDALVNEVRALCGGTEGDVHRECRTLLELLG